MTTTVAPRWEIYIPENGKKLSEGPYTFGGPFPTRKQALAARDRFAHRWGMNLGVRRVEKK
jgi:hypothetical protein